MMTMKDNGWQWNKINILYVDTHTHTFTLITVYDYEHVYSHFDSKVFIIIFWYITIIVPEVQWKCIRYLKGI